MKDFLEEAGLEEAQPLHDDSERDYGNGMLPLLQYTWNR